MKTDEKTISVIITKKQFSELQEIANKEDRTVSSIIRLLIVKLIEKEIKIQTTIK